LEKKYFDDFVEDMKGQGEDMSFLIYEDEPKQKNKNGHYSFYDEFPSNSRPSQEK
jgi:hypothetical protein